MNKFLNKNTRHNAMFSMLIHSLGEEERRGREDHSGSWTESLSFWRADTQQVTTGQPAPRVYT